MKSLNIRRYLRTSRTFVLLAATLLTLQPVAYAITPEQRRSYNYQDILFIDEPCQAASQDPIASSGENVLAAMQYFVGKGLTPEQAAGIIGNLRAESGVLPARQEGKPPSYIAEAPINGIGFGIAQWTYTSRQAPLVAAAQQAGVPVNTLPIQLDYVWSELNGSYSDVLRELRNTTDIREATNIVLLKYEAPRVKDEAVLTLRTRLAEGALRQFTGAGGTATTTGINCTNPNTETGAGATCETIGQKSAELDKNNPYACSNKDMLCPAGSDGGIQSGYADGVQYLIRVCDVQGIRVNAFIAAQIDALITKSALPPAQGGLGKALTGGGFRSMEARIALWYAANCDSGHCDWPVARPGYSNHQMALAIDFSGIAIHDPRNPKFIWLSQNAANYGLRNLPTESWHWSVNGR